MFEALLIEIIKVAIVVGGLMNVGGLLTWVERKQSAYMQDRIGPNRANLRLGRFNFTLAGLLHPLADGIKMFTKEDFRPRLADPILFPLAPFLAYFPAVVSFAVIPWGGTLHIGDHVIPMQIADLNIGILFVFAIVSASVYGVVLAGWASFNKWSLIGGLRAASQMLSYEVSMGLSAMGIFMIFGTLSMSKIAEAQGELIFGFLPKWGIFLQPVAFFLFAAAAIAEAKRTPFDIPESESEIVAGYFTEYSGMKFGMFYLGEFLEVVLASAMITTLFLGSYQIPYMTSQGLQLPGLDLWAISPNVVAILQCLAFAFKVLVMIFLLQTIRWTLPRFRYDQLMTLGWKMMFPIAIANLLLTALLVLLIGS